MPAKGRQASKGLVTSHDVAKLACVSQPTVSRALRGQRGVAAETLQRVQAAAIELGYVPSQLGRGLATRSTKRIGIVAGELTNPLSPHLVEPLHDHFKRAGYRSVLFAEREDDPIALADLGDGLLDGVILTTTLIGSRLPEELAQRGLPFVFLSRTSDNIDVDAVVVDDAYGGRLVADLLVETGHTRIGAIFGPIQTSTGREREAGFRQRLAEHGVELGDEVTVRGAFSFVTGVTGMRAVLSAAEPPTAVFCANDVIALGAVDEVTRLGVRVPQDLSVVGFDNINAAGWNRFDLTTVRCDLDNLAAVAADLLLKRIADPGRVHSQVVQRPKLVLRGSHAAPAASRARRRPAVLSPSS
jgi:LacI family transcriptional regulator